MRILEFFLGLWLIKLLWPYIVQFVTFTAMVFCALSLIAFVIFLALLF